MLATDLASKVSLKVPLEPVGLSPSRLSWVSPKEYCFQLFYGKWGFLLVAKTPPSSSITSAKFGTYGKSQHDALTLKHAPCWVAIATGSTLIKTSPGTEIRRDEYLNH